MRRTASPDLVSDEYANLAVARRLMRRYLAFSERAAASAGLEPQQYQLLLMLRGLTAHGAASVADLADWLQVRHHSAVGLVDRMQARELVERRSDRTDRRRVVVTLTPKGESALVRLAIVHRDELRRLAPALVMSLSQIIDHQPTDPVPELALHNPVT